MLSDLGAGQRDLKTRRPVSSWARLLPRLRRGRVVVVVVVVVHEGLNRLGELRL